jgi:hypothetical protein
MAYNGSRLFSGWYNASIYNGGSAYQRDLDERAAATEQEEADRVHRISLKAARASARVLANLAAAEPAPQPAPAPTPIAPDPVLVAKIAAQLTNVRAKPTPSAGWSVGIFLPPS